MGLAARLPPPATGPILGQPQLADRVNGWGCDASLRLQQFPQSLNLYAYVLNNPATATDPDGHWCVFGAFGTTCASPAKAPPKEGGVAAAAGADAMTGGLDTTAILNGLEALGDAVTVGTAGEFAVVFSVINSPGDADPALLAKEKAQGGSKSAPRSSPKFQKPTNPPQPPPKDIPPGWRVRVMPPTSDYPDGYWRLEKPLGNGSWQPIDPSTMRPGAEPETHIPLPGGGGE